MYISLHTRVTSFASPTLFNHTYPTKSTLDPLSNHVHLPLSSHLPFRLFPLKLAY